ncbi:uncharacterized protein H6S33_006147 [Morchella sextelata]|jgi:hypothetical protein|uniref:uncharacterized protein n=1 Tax=Morchella sextelata TaxID=1174677 RepID=UPI001D045602|nr:uncharacterized protein H6S33_006147 [Morchella sextelata]KAH0614261.1 hypothetical protein H6S33_006147 [Morchella sextelata]
MANCNAHTIIHMKQQIEFLEYQIEFCAVQNQRLYHVLFESHLFAPCRLWRDRFMFTPKSHDHGFADGFVECYTMYQGERSALIRYVFGLRQRLEQLARFLVREETGRVGRVGG